MSVPLVKSAHQKHNFLIYIVGTQKNCLNETVLLSTHNLQFSAEKNLLI